MTRNNYVDFCRGIAAVNIVFIHTTFWSGTYYVPVWMQSVSLLLDVPFFFFLAGWGRAYSPSISRTFRSLVLLYGKYCFFISALFLFLKLSGLSDFHFSDYLATLSFIGAEPTLLPVVMGSMWFMPELFTVVPLCIIVIHCISSTPSKCRESAFKLSVLIGFILYLWSMMGFNYLFLSRQTLFYCLFFLIGYCSFWRSITRKQFFTVISALVIASLIIASLLDVDITCLQNLKFPPHIVYFLLSLLSVTFAVFFKDRFSPSHQNWFVIIGKNAIWFYYAQGISSSLIFYLTNRLSCFWGIKLMICALVNILLTAVIAFLLAYLYRRFSQILAIAVDNIHPKERTIQRP